MKIAYELRQQDFLEALTAHRNSRIFAKWATRIFLAIAGLITAVILLNVIVRRSAETVMPYFPFFLAVAGWILILWALPRWTARRQFTGQPSAKGPRTLTLDETGTHWSWDGGSADVAWKNYIRSVESDSLILLYTSPACFNIFPKRSLTADEVKRIREMIEQNVPAAK